MTKLLQLNMWGGRLDRQIMNLLKQERADILCLQEAISFTAGDDSGFFLSIENIQQALGLSYSTIAPVFTFKYMNDKARFSNCIISRYPIQKSEIVFTHLDHKEDFVFGVDSSNVRNFIHTVIDIDGLPTNVLTHHGFHVPDHKEGNEETMKQMEILADYISGLDGPIILTGDFNLAPDSKSLNRLNSSLTNLSIAHKLQTTRTELTHKTEVCDYIFVNKSVRVQRFIVSKEIVSDHQAMILNFKVK